MILFTSGQDSNWKVFDSFGRSNKNQGVQLGDVQISSTIISAVLSL